MVRFMREATTRHTNRAAHPSAPPDRNSHTPGSPRASGLPTTGHSSSLLRWGRLQASESIPFAKIPARAACMKGPVIACFRFSIRKQHGTFRFGDEENQMMVPPHRVSCVELCLQVHAALTLLQIFFAPNNTAYFL